jgi:alcohol dehydrogenase class IV
MSQGANPWSDVGAKEALRLTGQYLVRASQDPQDLEAREQMMFAATLAGIAFGNAGVHIPHSMSYSVAGMVKDFYPNDYPQDHAMCPHGMSVILNAPAAFEFTADACPERHLLGAELLGANIQSANLSDAGLLLSEHLKGMMKATSMPNGIGGLGYKTEHVDKLSKGAIAQQRLLKNSPKAVLERDLHEIYNKALSYW